MSNTFTHITLVALLALYVGGCVGLPEGERPPPPEIPPDPTEEVYAPEEENEDTSSLCPRIPVVQHFQPFKYLGRWYEIERFDAPFQMGDCVTADYGLFPNCSISVVNSNVVQGKLESIFAYATAGPDPTLGRLIVQFPSVPGEPAAEPNYNIVVTDYDNYAVIYGCEDLGQGKTFEFSWILGRHPQLDEDFLVELKKWLQLVGITVDKYMKTNQQQCLRRPL